MKTVGDLLDKWPSDARFARDLGLTQQHVSSMRRRNSLPRHFWLRIVAKARERSISGVSIASLANLMAKIQVSKVKAA